MAHIKLGNNGRKRPITDEAGGSSLPAVTSSDAGKVLAVNGSGEWAAEQYAGYDIVIKVDDSKLDENITSDMIHLLKGDYNSCIAKSMAGYPIIALVYGVYSDEQEVYAQNFMVYGTYVDKGDSNSIIICTSTDQYSANVSVRNPSDTGTLSIAGAMAETAVGLFTIDNNGISYGFGY